MSATRGPHTSPSPSTRARRAASLALVCAGVGLLALTLLSDARVGAVPRDPAAPAPRFVSTAAEPAAAAAQGADFSRFTHSNPNHSRLPCLLCHRREDAGTRPRRSGHTPCAGCHAPQFADQQSPICTICHTNPPSARGRELHSQRAALIIAQKRKWAEIEGNPPPDVG